MADDGRPVCDVCGVVLRWENGAYIPHEHYEVEDLVVPTSTKDLPLPDLELEVLLLEEALIEKRNELEKAQQIVRNLEADILGREDLLHSVIKILPWYRTIRS